MLTVKAECSQPTPAAERTTRPGDAVANCRAQPLTFEQIVDRHQAYVARLVRRLLGWGAAGDVEDVVQEVFLAVLQGLPRFRGESSVGTWLTRITINACRNHRRGRMMRLAFFGKWIRHAPTEHQPGPGGGDERDETRRRVRQAVGGLPNRYREVVVLRYLEGMDVDQVAAVLGLTRGAIDVRLHRARALLKDELNELVRER